VNVDQQKSLLNLLRGSLRSLPIIDGQPDVWTDEFRRSISAVTRAGELWLEDSDSAEIIYAYIRVRLGRYTGEDCQLHDVMSEPDIDAVAADVVDWIEVLPQSYEIHFPMRGLELTEELRLHPRIKLYRTPPESKTH
jgi:hypothetical protein